MAEPAAGTQLPHGIMGLQPQALPWNSAILAAIVLVGLAALVWLFWTKRRRRIEAGGSNTVAAVLPQDPWERLNQALQVIDTREPWTREACEEFFFRLSFLLREALELRTGLPITGQTLAETTTSLTKTPVLSANFQQELIKFLSQAEQLKFAGQWLSDVDSKEWREKVKTWLEELRTGALS